MNQIHKFFCNMTQCSQGGAGELPTVKE
ncbi:hypothetical protein, partial [Shigella sonnei]